MKAIRYGPRQVLHITLALGWSDFILKYRGSMLGYIWSLLGPLVQFVVIYHIFKPFVSRDVQHYPLYLFLGLLLWEHFATTTTACMSVLRDKADIIQRVPFPRLILILSVGWTYGIVLITRLALFVALTLFLGISLGRGYFLLPVLLIQLTLFALGIGMLLSAYSLRFRDVPHLWSVCLLILFWLTPITYPFLTRAVLLQEASTRLPMLFSLNFHGLLDLFIRFQPLSLLFTEVRRLLLYGDTIMPSTVHILFLTSVCLCTFTVGALVFIRRSKFFLEEY